MAQHHIAHRADISGKEPATRAVVARELVTR
jgi:hypothetical protein